MGDFVCQFYNAEERKITITKYKGSAKDVKIPEKINNFTVVAIEGGAFNDKQLTSVIIPNTVTTIGIIAFANNKLTSITVPNSITSIGEGAFSNNQLTNITIPNTITTIKGFTFENNQLTSISLPNSVTIIESFAFADNKLTSVTIPKSVTTIGWEAFKGNRLPNEIMSKGVNVSDLEAIDKTRLIDDKKKGSIAVTALAEGWKTPPGDEASKNALVEMRKKAISMIGIYKPDDISVYSLLEKSYTNGEGYEKALSINALASLKPDTSAELLSKFLMDLNAKRLSGTTNNEDEALVRTVIPAIGRTGNAKGRVALNEVSNTDWSITVKHMAELALKQLE